jgi:UDP-glucose 4-epimerase
MKKKYLVTGGAGFIGSHLSESLSKKGKVIVIDNLFQGNKLKLNKNIKLVIGDVRDKKLIKKYSKGCSSIFHLAAIIGVDIVSKNKVENMNVEFEGLKNVCEAAKKNNIKKIIYASSSGVYGKLNYSRKVKEDAIIVPASGYAMAKRASEIYLKNFQKEENISCVSLRLFNVYGQRQDSRMVIPRFVSQAKKNIDIIIYGNGQQTRDFTHIDDCVKTFELVEKKIKGYKIFNSSRGDDTKILNLAKIIKRLYKSKSKIKLIRVPNNLSEFQVKKRCGNSNKLLSYINFKPTKNLIEGLKQTYF